MASCGFGTSSVRVHNVKLGYFTPKSSDFTRFYCWRALRIAQFDGLALSHRSKKPVMRCTISMPEADPTTDLEESSEEKISSDMKSTLIPSALEVESLLAALCDTKSIVEFELKLGGFQLNVTRKLSEEITHVQPPSPAPVTAHSVAETPSVALAKTVPSSNGVQTLLDKAADEGLVILKSPRVGYFRRSRTIKGKRAPPSCKEKDTVKEGQVLCYIEQLGGEIPLESDISGEVVKILKEDGDPVGFGDALIAVLPSFPGIMKLQ